MVRSLVLVTRVLLIAQLHWGVFLFCRYIVDHDDPSLGKPSVGKWVLRIILLLLQLAPLLRYCDALSYGLRSRAAAVSGNRQRQSKLYRRMLDEDSNGALLRLFHCFLHAAPQALVQLMILLQNASEEEALTQMGLSEYFVMFI